MGKPEIVLVVAILAIIGLPVVLLLCCGPGTHAAQPTTATTQHTDQRFTVESHGVVLVGPDLGYGSNRREVRHGKTHSMDEQ